MEFVEQLPIGLAVALGAGLLIGIERERRKGSGPGRALAGVRTFALAALSGAIAQTLAQPWLVAIGALLIVALAAIARWRERRTDDPGITTELALFATYLLGVGAIDYPALVAGAAVVIAILLAARNKLHRFSTAILSAAELRDGLIWASAALVILPLLPNHSIAWLAGANPRRLWGLVVLFMSLQAGGYIALRLAGPSLGLALSSLASGFVSSTATIAALGARARANPQLLASCVLGALMSTVATVVLLAIVAITVHAGSIAIVAPSLLAALLVALSIVAIALRRLQRPPADTPPGRVFNLVQSLVFPVVLTTVSALVALADRHFGHVAVTLGTGLAGFFDVHAASASVFSLAASGGLTAPEILLPVLIAFSTNTFSKLVVAYGTGGARYGARVGAGLIAIALAAWLPLLFI